MVGAEDKGLFADSNESSFAIERDRPWIPLPDSEPGCAAAALRE
jgi:hypothetical protein